MIFIDKIKAWSLKKKIIILSSIVAVIAAIVIVCVVLLNHGGYVATTMRLLRVEGTVSIEDSLGNSKPVIDNIRFQSGDALSTGADGLASVGLDDTKIVTLQNDSRAEFRKKNKKLELKLTRGALFFEVTEKLQDDESFEIQTSTMIVGIRGTSGYVFYDEDGREALIITDGVVHVVATNPDTGEIKEEDVPAGCKIKVYHYNDRKENTVEFFLQQLSEEELPEFPILMIAENPDLLKKVCEFTGWDEQTIKEMADRLKKGEPLLTPTPTPEPSPSPEVTFTPTPVPTDTPIPSPTDTPTPTPKPKKGTPTPSPSPTPTPVPPTPSPVPTPTPSPTPEPTPTPTPVPTPTNTPIPTPTPTLSPIPTPEAKKGPDEDTMPAPDKYVWDTDDEVYICADGEEVFWGYIDGEWIELDPAINEVGDDLYRREFLYDGDNIYYSEPFDING